MDLIAPDNAFAGHDLLSVAERGSQSNLFDRGEDFRTISGRCPEQGAHPWATQHPLGLCDAAGDVPTQRNPMESVRIKEVTKRWRIPRSLTLDEFQKFIQHLSEPLPHDRVAVRLFRPSHQPVSCAEVVRY